IHMVNGENPHVGFDFYVETTRSLHEAMPDVHLKLYTASEIHHMSTLSGLSHGEVLRELQDAGLGSLPGGGAEVFAERVRRLIAQVALHFGANDVQGTVVREEIFHAAGATTPTEQKLDELVRFVRDAGRVPVQRDTLYNELGRW